MKFYILILSVVLFSSCKNTSKEHQETSQEETTQVETINFPSSAKSQTPYLVLAKDNLYLSWQETENDTLYFLKYSELVGNAFSKPQTITSGNNWFVNWADYPMISENNGVMLAHTLQKSATGTYTYDVMLNVKEKEGNNWSKSFKLHNDNTQSEHGFVSMLPYKDNQFFVTWLDGRNTVDVEEKDRAMNLRGAFIDVDGSITSDTLLDNKVCDCCQTIAVMTQNGPAVIYRDRSDTEVRDMSIVRHVDGNWTPPKTVHNDNWKIAGCPVNGPRADALENTVAVAWFASPNENSKVNVAFSNNNGEAFQKPVKVDLGNPIGRVDLVLLSKSKAIVTWMEDDNILARSVTSNGSLGKVITISKTSESRASGFPQMEVFKNEVYFALTMVDKDRNTSLNIGKLPVNNF